MVGLHEMVLTLIYTCKYICRINIDTLEVTLQPLSGDLPGQKLGSSLAFYDNTLYLFGYYWSLIGLQSQDNLYAYDLSLHRWRIVETGPLRPCARAFHASFVYNSELYILYGMVIEDSQMLNSIWKFNFPQNSWIEVSAISGDELGYSDMVRSGPIIYSVFGLGTSVSYNWVFSLDLSQASPVRTLLTNNWDFPVRRKNHCGFVINDQMVIFGGISEDGNYLNDIWYFDMTLILWSYVVATGQVPPPRELAGCGDTGRNAFIVFGGRDGTNIYNDLYYYDSNLNFWNRPPISFSSPSPRYSSRLVFNGYTTFILGGQNDMQILSDIWMYSYFEGSIDVINAQDSIKIELVDYHCWLDTSQGIVIYVLGGRDSNFRSANSLYSVTVSENDGVYSTSTKLLHETQQPIPAESGMVQDGDNIYVIFGSFWKKIAVSQIFVINYKTFEEYYMKLDSSLALYGHTAVHYKDSLYIMGGSSTIIGIELGFLPNNEFYKLTTTANDSVFLGCSPGTLEPYCTPCPAGYIYQNSQCIGCPAGRYSTAIASTASTQCMPCTFGSYTSNPGSTYCLDCPAGKYCPIGSSSPIDRGTSAPYQTMQPSAYIGKTQEISILVTELWYAAISLFGVLILVTIIHRNILKILKDFDILVDLHDQELNLPVVYRKTQIGGLFSVIFLLSAGIIIIGSFLTYYLDNITELKSLVPVLLLETQVSSATVQITASFYLYGGMCVENSACISTNNILDSGISYLSRSLLCSKQGSTCTISLSYTDFSLQSDSTVQIQMLETLASATSMSVNVTSTSSIPNQQSSVFIPISTGSDLLVFLGTSPTVVSYEFTPSVINI